MQDQATQSRPVAVFDYDGTCIDGQSGLLIATWLLKQRRLTPRAVVGLSWWGARYKLHLPHRQEQARELIFTSLKGYTPEQIDQLMVEFHNEVLVPRYRLRAVEEIIRRKEEGCAVVLVSATFNTIAREGARYLDADGYVATEMARDETGTYTARVLGDVIEGQFKVDAATAWANKTLGEGAWHLAYAYGDHHSDIELLEAADKPLAVSPGPTLKRVANEKGWPIADWRVR